MRTDPTEMRTLDTSATYQPSRVVVGHCPDCRRVCVLVNEYDCWPPAVCHCGWSGPSFALTNHARLDNGGHVEATKVGRYVP